jgi:hypothetical protein
MTNKNKTLEGYAYVEGIVIPEYSKFQSAYYPFGDYKPFFGTFKHTGEFSYETQPIPTYKSTKDLIISNYDAPTKYTQVALPTFEVRVQGILLKSDSIPSLYNEFVFDTEIQFTVRERSDNAYADELLLTNKQYNNISYTYSVNVVPTQSKSNLDIASTNLNLKFEVEYEDAMQPGIFASNYSDITKIITKIIDVKIRTVNYFDNAINIVNSSVGNLSTITNKMKLFYESLNLNTNITTLSTIKNSSKLYSDSLNLNTTITTLSTIENILNTSTNNELALVAEITTLSVEENEQTEFLS